MTLIYNLALLEINAFTLNFLRLEGVGWRLWNALLESSFRK